MSGSKSVNCFSVLLTIKCGIRCDIVKIVAKLENGSETKLKTHFNNILYQIFRKNSYAIFYDMLVKSLTFKST